MDPQTGNVISLDQLPTLLCVRASTATPSSFVAAPPFRTEDGEIYSPTLSFFADAQHGQQVLNQYDAELLISYVTAPNLLLHSLTTGFTTYRVVLSCGWC